MSHFFQGFEKYNFLLFLCVHGQGFLSVSINILKLIILQYYHNYMIEHCTISKAMWSIETLNIFYS